MNSLQNLLRVLPLARVKPKKVLLLASSVCAVVALIVFFVCWRITYLRSPQFVLDETVHALQVGDFSSIYRLGYPAERKFLNITPQAVKDILQATIWRHGYPQEPKVMYFPSNLEDVKQWLVTWEKPKFKESQNLAVVVMQSPNGRWGLNVSALLANICRMVGLSYNDLAQKEGLRGVCLEPYSYMDFDGQVVSEQSFSEGR